MPEPNRQPSAVKLRRWFALTKDKPRRQEGMFLAEGFKVVQELFRSPWTTEALLLSAGKADRYGGFLSTIPPGTPVYSLSEGDWRRLTQDRESEGIMAVVVNRPPKRTDRFGFSGTEHVVVLHRIGNPNNLGAIIRTAHWFGIGRIVLSRGSVDYTNPKVVRSSMGSIFHLDITADCDLPEMLGPLGRDRLLVAAVPSGGISPHPCSKPTALIMGSESHGLPDEIIARADEVWCTPGGYGADSLSLPQAAAIVMYECSKTKRDGK